MTETGVTFEIDNKDNPFYKKEIKVGTTSENESAIFKITALSKDEVTLEVTNRQSPFYNKEFGVGSSFELPQGGKVNIIAITDTMVTI
jgi:ribosomal protein L31